MIFALFVQNSSKKEIYFGVFYRILSESLMAWEEPLYSDGPYEVRASDAKTLVEYRSIAS